MVLLINALSNFSAILQPKISVKLNFTYNSSVRETARKYSHLLAVN